MKESKLSLMLLTVLGACFSLGIAIHAQDSNKAAPSIGVSPTPVAPVAAARKSYPLPEPLAEQISRLVNTRNLAEQALLQYIANPKIYEATDDTLRAAVFDRQQKLFTQLQTATANTANWVLAQRKEFQCDTCEANRSQDGKWMFVEPEPQGGK